VFFGINVAVHGPPWFVFPSAVLFLGVVWRGINIWADGIGPIDAFKKGIRRELREQSDGGASPAPSREPLLAARPAIPAGPAVPAEVLAGGFGDGVRRALDDRIVIREIASTLTGVERELVPDVGPTVDALAERVVGVAATLHRLDADVSGASLGALDSRIAALETEPATDERERRLALLQRQRGSLHDLIERRRTLANQLESASLMLQNLKLDMLKLRSSGIGSTIAEQASATQEARALSREIGHVVQAADELRKLS
jgi:serine/threonine-protein kinase